MEAFFIDFLNYVFLIKLNFALQLQKTIGEIGRVKHKLENYNIFHTIACR